MKTCKHKFAYCVSFHFASLHVQANASVLFFIFTLSVRKGVLRKTRLHHFPFDVNSSSCVFSPQAHLGINAALKKHQLIFYEKKLQ